MDIYTLVVRADDTDTGVEMFLFDSHPEFLRAESAAQSAGVFMARTVRKTSNLTEFKTWLEKEPSPKQ